MKISKQLARILREASKEVSKWEDWQRSIDPQGNKKLAPQRAKKER